MVNDLGSGNDARSLVQALMGVVRAVLGVYSRAYILAYARSSGSAVT